MVWDLRERIGREEFDYQTLLAALKAYANPRQKITSLLRKGIIIRVKKGLYVFGPGQRRRPFSRELLANLIYGPSCVSLDYVLARSGLIPERVEAVTSATTKRPARFNTPIGVFIYRQVPERYFSLGLNVHREGDNAFLIARPERALADKIRDDRGAAFASMARAERYLFEDLRVDEHRFLALDASLFFEIAKAARSGKLITCASLLVKKQETHE